MIRAGLALASVLGAQEPLVVGVWAAPAADSDLVRWCQALVGEGVALRLVDGAPAVSEGEAAAIEVFLGAPLTVLHQQRTASPLASRELWPVVRDESVGGERTFAVLWSEPLVLAWNSASDAEPERVEDLLWERPFDQKVVLPVGSGAPEMWAGWREGLRLQFGPAKAEAWLTRLDGRVGRYVDNPLAAREVVAGAPGWTSVLPRGLVTDVPGITWIAPEEGAPSRLLAVAATADPRAQEFLDRLLEPASLAQLAELLDLSPPTSGSLTEGRPLDPELGSRVGAWWKRTVRGKGAPLERLDFWLDVVLGTLMVTLMLGIFWRIRKHDRAG